MKLYIVVLLLILVVILGIYLYPLYVVGRTKSKGMEIITMIEKYKTEHSGLYPVSLQQLGVEIQPSGGASIYKGNEFFYDCDFGGEFFLDFYFSDHQYSYSSVLRSWGIGDRGNERNCQIHKLHDEIMSPENQKNISDKWFYDSIYYSRQDSQNVANVRLFYKNGKLAARGKVLLRISLYSLCKLKIRAKSENSQSFNNQGFPYISGAIIKFLLNACIIKSSCQ